MSKFNLILCCFILLILSSCSDELEEQPKATLSSDQVFSDESGASDAVTGAFSAFYTNSVSRAVAANDQSDIINARGSQSPFSDFGKILNEVNVGRVRNVWQKYYKTINQAYFVIEHLKEMDNIDEQKKDQFLGEMKFLIGFSYFDLVRGWGDIPLIKKSFSDFSQFKDYSTPRVSEDSVYNFIIDITKDAINKLPESVGDDTGRPSKYAAKMLLANVYLTTEQWGKAADAADDVITSGQYSLIKVKEPDDFYDIFATKTNSEDIFAIHHNKDKEGGRPHRTNRPNTPPYNYASGGIYSWMPNMKSALLSNWDDDDLRKEFNLHDTYIGEDGEEKHIPSSPPFLFSKYKTDTEGRSVYSDFIYRLTEAYLIYAEAASMDNGSPTPLAIERLNHIKRRGYGYNMESSSPIDYNTSMGLKDLQDAVLKEKAKEFIAEGKRWFDLKRTGRAEEFMHKAGRDWIDERLLWPIPYNEIQNNPSLDESDQNPGY